MELGVLDGVMGDGVFLLDGDGGPLVVFKIHIPVPVRVKRDQLRVGIREVGRRHRLFRDLVHAGQQVLHRGGAVRPGGHFGHAMAVLPLDQKHRAGDWRAGVGVALVDGQVGTLVILQADGGVLAWEQLHMVLRGVQDMVRHGGHLLQGVHPRLQALPADRAIRPGGAVQVPGAILNFGQPVGDAAQGCTVRALLMQMETGQLGIGEHELRLLIPVQVDNALGVVHHIAGTLQLRHHISTHGELAEVDGPVLGRGVLLRPPGAVHRLDTEAGVGDGLAQIGAVHLDEMDAGQAVIEENQFFDAVPGLQLHFLGCGVQHMAVSAGVPFLHAVGAGSTVCQQDLTELVRSEDAQILGVPEYLKGDAGHELHAAPLIFNDPQTGQLLVGDGGGGFLTGHYGYGLYRVCIGHPAVDARQLPDFPTAGGQLIKDDDAVSGLTCPGLAGLNVLDLDGDAGEGVAGVAPLLHPQ